MKMRIAVLSHEFLINVGANDLLKNFLVALNSRQDVDILFLVPTTNILMEQKVKRKFKGRIWRNAFVKRFGRIFLRWVQPGLSLIREDNPGIYDFYRLAAPRMEILESDVDEKTLIELCESKQIDVFFPSIHALPPILPYVTYWPDCQPKHFPEFFDDQSQALRDGMITSLFATKKPMIINSRNAKDDMIKFYGAPERQIHSLPFAPFLDSINLNPNPELITKYEVPNDYFIVCNQFWLHKSIETVFQAIAETSKDERTTVVFTGRMEEPRSPGYIKSLLSMVDELGITEHVRLLGYIPKEDQLALISRSISVIQPTLFEGGPGGGSVYDGIALGKRCIITDIPINHEIQGYEDLVTFFTPKDAKALANAMHSNRMREAPIYSYEHLYHASQSAIRQLASSLLEVLEIGADRERIRNA